MKSIRRFLLAGTLGVVTVVILLTSVMSYEFSRHEIAEIYDANLVQYARVLNDLLAQNDFDTAPLAAPLVSSIHDTDSDTDYDTDSDGEIIGPDGKRLAQVGHWYERNFVFQLWDGQHDLRLSNTRELETPLAAFEVGLRDVMIAGHEWRVFVQHDTERQRWLLVGEHLYVRDELVAELALSTVMPGLLSLPLVLALVYWIVGRGLAPLLKMTGEVGERAPDNLQQIDVGNLPVELAPLSAAINRLLARLESALQRERQLAADAAHELRTPLAILRVHAQNALNADSDEARNKALNSLVTGVDRTTHLVGQLLSLARAGERGDATPESLDLNALVRQEVAELVPLALARNQELGFDSTEHPARLRGDAAGLRGLVRNLVENAIRYTPPGGNISVHLEPAGDTLRLRVTDSGPGIPEALRERVFDSFYRPADSETDGAGLGLSIVRRVADRHHAHTSMGNDPHSGSFFIDVTFDAQA